MSYNTYHSVKRLVAIDCIIFGYDDEKLKLLLFKRHIEPAKGHWSLIGGWVNQEESVEDAALRVLESITGLQQIYLEQVRVFSEQGRDPGGSVMSVAFYALIKIEKQSPQTISAFGAEWFPLDQVPQLIFDHHRMLESAFEKLRLKATYNLIGRQLLPEKFTIPQLRNLYNQIFQKNFDPGNFRKKLLSLKLLERLEEKDHSESKKGAFYYRFRHPEGDKPVEPIFRNGIRF